MSSLSYHGDPRAGLVYSADSLSLATGINPYTITAGSGTISSGSVTVNVEQEKVYAVEYTLSVWDLVKKSNIVRTDNRRLLKIEGVLDSVKQRDANSESIKTKALMANFEALKQFQHDLTELDIKVNYTLLELKD